MTHPDKIWLQGGNITWCDTSINDDDVEYVKADELAKKDAEIATYKAFLVAVILENSCTFALTDAITKELIKNATQATKQTPE